MAFDGKYFNPIGGQIGGLNIWNYGPINDPDSPAYDDTLTTSPSIGMDWDTYFNDAVKFGLKNGDILFLYDAATNRGGTEEPQVGVRFVNIDESTGDVDTRNLIAK
jgi:hypothetical protein